MISASQKTLPYNLCSFFQNNTIFHPGSFPTPPLSPTPPSASALRAWPKADLLAIDDIMLFHVKKEESASFFNLVNSLHEKTSVIITTNKAPTEWVQTLNDEVLATAIIDRLLYRCEVIKLAGTSYRLENRKTIFTSEPTVNGKQLRKVASKTIETQV